MYDVIGDDDASQWFGPLTDLYAMVYAEPPYTEGPEQVARFSAGLPEEAERPGFRLVVAVTAKQLVGAAYGWTMPADVWWSRADQDPPADVLGADKVAVMEWMVHPAYRQQGIGAELMRSLFADRSEQWATLASDPRSAARSIYQRADWQQVGRSVLPWGPGMDLLVLPLRAAPYR